MNSPGSTRRMFLMNSGKFAASGALAVPLVELQQLLSQEISRVALTEDDVPDWDSVRQQYSLGQSITYLNHASIGTIPLPVQRAHGEYLRLCETNPWLYMWGGEWDQPREHVRKQSAELLGCETDEVALTHNTTEMFNTLAHGLPWKTGDEILFSSLNHAGASIAFENAKRYGCQVRRFEFPLAGVPDIHSDQIVEIYANQIRPETRLLVFPHVDNTVGLRYPVQALAQAAREKGVEFIAVDGAQTVGMIPVDVSKYNIDVYATSPHKWLGAPKGTGLAYVASSLHERLRPMWVTWGQTRWAGSARVYEDYGTRNLAEVLTLGHSIEFKQKIQPRVREARLGELRKHVVKRIEQGKSTQLASPRDFSSGSSVISVSLDRRLNCDVIAKQLFEKHQIVLRPFRSPTMNALRVSPNVFTSFNEIDHLFDKLQRL